MSFSLFNLEKPGPPPRCGIFDGSFLPRIAGVKNNGYAILIG